MLVSEIIGRSSGGLAGELGLMVSGTKVGVEIEIQTNSSSHPVDRSEYWRPVSEGSVQGFEIVLREPQGGTDLVSALEEAESLVDRMGGNEKFPEMTSVHVHVDVRDMTEIQLFNFLTLAIMFEPVLYNYVEPHRNKNHFCLPMSDADDVLGRLYRLVSRYRQHGNINRDQLRSLFSPDEVKYAGINLSSIPHYGSLEFRMHHGTASSTALIRWINVLLKMHQYAMEPNRSPNNILDTKIEVGIETIFQQVLGQYSGVLSYEGVDDDILDGIRNAQDFVALFAQPAGRNVLQDIPNQTLGG